MVATRATWLMSAELTPIRAATSALGVIRISGRTRDANLQFLAQRLGELGIPLREACVIPDVRETIIATLNEVRATFTYVFTTGGIGPTHDDITVDAVAKALGVGVIIHPAARAILENYYTARGTELTEARLRMARGPAYFFSPPGTLPSTPLT